jgi:hypothetical protein
MADSVSIDQGTHILLKPGHCSEGGIQRPNIIEGMMDQSLNALNVEINANFLCLFDPLPSARTDDYRIT